MSKSNQTQGTPVAPQSTAYYRGKEAIWRKSAFGCGTVGYNLIWMVVSSYLMFFMTDVALVPATAVSALFLGCRLWDAVNDPMIGLLADHTRSRFGRYRPWLIMGPLVLLPSVILLFWAHPTWSESARTTYACITYCIAVVGATMVDIPYGGLQAALTPDSLERASFSSYRIFFSAIASALATGYFLKLVDAFGGSQGHTERGYVLTILLLCVVSIPFFLICFFGTKEVVHPPKGQKLSGKKLASLILKSPPILIIILVFFVQGFMVYGRMTTAMYYFTYNWGNMGLFGTYTLFNGLITGAAAFAAPLLLKVFKNKRSALLLGYVGTALCTSSLYLLNPGSTSPFVALGLLWAAGAFLGVVNCMLYAMVPDAVEYGQWKVGIRADGFVFSGTSFMMKAGGAISPALLALLMSTVGYVPNASQNATTLNLMASMVSWVPAALCLLAAILILFYKLDSKTHAKSLKEINERDHSVDMKVEG